ncbi:MAG TPA: PAS domain S-box protein [Methanospirillum sp.]|nr:PAS domain S-box protein [Methanospirillum sp.]
MNIPGTNHPDNSDTNQIAQTRRSHPYNADSGEVPIHILYVDDDPDMAVFFRTFLQRMGNFPVTALNSGIEALSYLQTDNPIDIIISDYHMPGMDGIELLKQSRLFPNPPPFILFTGKGREEVVMEAINNGAAFYLQKGGDSRALFAELVHKIRQAVGKKQAELALRENEEKFRLLFESARDGIIILKKGHIIDCNHQAGVLFSIPPQDLLGQTPEKLSPEYQTDGSKSGDKAQAYMNQVLAGSPAFFPWRHRRTDGSVFDTEVSLTFVLLDGEPCLQAVIRDITDRIRAEEELARSYLDLEVANEEMSAVEQELRAQMIEILENEKRLRESELKFRELADLLPQAVFECDTLGYITYANRQAYETFGFKTDIPLPKTRVLDMIAPEDRQRAVDSLTRLQKAGLSEPHEYYALRYDGTRFPAIVHSAPVIRDGGYVGLRGIVIDITDRKKAEEAIIRSEEKYRTLIDHIQDGVFIVQNGRMRLINPAYARIIGYTVPELTERRIADIIAPEDRDEVIDRYRRRHAGEQVPEQFEFHMLHKDGKTRILIHMDVGLILFEGHPASIGTIRDVTEKRRAEEELRESKRRLADVISFLPDATCVIDRQGIVTDWNRAMELLTGIPAHEMIGKGDFEYSIPFYGVKRPILIDMALKEYTNTEQSYALVNRIGETVIGEAYMPNMGGGTTYLWGAASPLRNASGEIIGAIESIRDITDRKKAEDEILKSREELEIRVADRTSELLSVNKTLRTEVEERRLAEEALRESEERYRRLVELSPDTIFVHDGTQICFFNQAGVRLLGAERAQDLIGRQVLDLIHQDDKASVRTRILTLMNEGEPGPMVEEKFIRLDGSVVEVEVSSAPILYQGNQAVLVVVRDITRRRKVEEQLKRYAQDMKDKNKELDHLTNQLLDNNQELDKRVRERTEQVLRLMKQKDDFITQIGHDLKTPLTPLKALLPSLIDEEQDPGIKESLTVLLRSVHSIQTQTEKILTIARLTREDVVIESEPVPIRHIIAESAQKNWLFIDRKHLVLTMDVPEDLRGMFSIADAEAVFDNLIGNACKYTRPDGHITISHTIKPGTICISIQDDGIGLSPEQAEHVFDEFYMVDGSRHDRSSSGLGLSIVRRLVGLYGGSIQVVSGGPGMGACFTVCMRAPSAPK